MKKISKRFKGLIEQQKKEKIDSLEKKIDSVKKMSNAKFVESIDLSFKLNDTSIDSSNLAEQLALTFLIASSML